MAKTESNMLPLGTKAPAFTLPDTVSGKLISLEQIVSDKATVIMFICNHCPYVIHVNPELVRISNEYLKKGVSFIAINSNDVENYPDDSPENMQRIAKELGYNFPYLFDETQEIAKVYDAACTPDFYIFDQNQELVYRGRMDESRPYNYISLTGKDLREALDAVLAKKPVNPIQYPSLGCNIKWK